ncbi:hypothetical protein Pla52n_54620 [Stieleria varia]|uniref:Uncharacterized protein n=1 Tax=Stieleria varia TaxID=2528005 RepID=A0A5C6A6E9_9BACT|nr:hypothetical protein Pla52n_54620 [Stieleria varia]
MTYHTPDFLPKIPETPQAVITFWTPIYRI